MNRPVFGTPASVYTQAYMGGQKALWDGQFFGMTAGQLPSDRWAVAA